MNEKLQLIECIKKIAVLEHRVDEQQNALRIIKNGIDDLEKMIKKLMDNPFGQNL